MPLDDFAAREGGKKFLEDFFPGLMANSYSGGKLWSIPFQRSTPVFYWNKDHFREAGLDPERPPKNWDELREYARKLTIRDGDKVNRWGLIIPGTWYDWTFEGFVRQNGGELMDPEGKRIQFSSPQALQALELWVELTQKDKVIPPVSTWGSTPPDFVAGRTSMLYHSTGSLRFFTDSVKFPFGVGFLPGRKSYGTPVGGANFHILRGTPAENQKAAWTFITWMTNTDNAAKWSIASGYIAVRKSAYNTAAMKEYAQKVPGILVARDHLEYAHARMGGPNFTKARINLVTRIEETLAGRLTAKQALDLVQKETLEIMRGK
ncbi:MAG: hypothetical protein A3H39_14380 [candidate division NC10 bacterium RIFCSPLOWO2_02_FULL_66_22]|nr:MAG: hypothetical protein A3H39_14380 [candidate division NC10 bacterium RIFCSPLOWO2_02_FULL_66_22]